MPDVLPIVLVALAGGALPLLWRWNERALHTALAFSTGIFLGAVFLHFLPTLSTLGDAGEAGAAAAHAEEHGDPAAGWLRHVHGDTFLWLCVLAGVLAVYFVEALVLRTHDHDDLHRHKAVGVATLVGLAVHALTVGVGYAATRGNERLSAVILVAILAHKGLETFSLTTVFQLAGFARRRILVMVVAFALVTPAGILVGEALTGTIGARGLGVLTALAAGTFLYVCLCELLVEVFHHREDSLLKIGLLTAGIALMVAFEGIAG